MMVGTVRPGLDHDADEWTAGAREAIELADRSEDDALRVALRVAGSYSHLCAGQWDEVERMLDEALEIAGDDHSVGSGIVIGCPVAWAVMAKGVIRRNRGQLDDAGELFETALRIAAVRGPCSGRSQPPSASPSKCPSTKTTSAARSKANSRLWKNGGGRRRRSRPSQMTCSSPNLCAAHWRDCGGNRG